jgi:STE24 endopeptidase
MPWKLYSTYVIEEKWGFNKTSAGTFVKDTVKSFAIGTVLTAIMLPLLLYVIDISGDNLVYYLTIVVVVFIVLIVILFPLVILPLFNVMTELEEGELRDAIFADAIKAQVPVS